MAIKFGPSGNSESFYSEGLKHSKDAPEWLKGRKLDAYEFSFGRGVTMGEVTALAIAPKFAEYGIEVSCHAPYYINLATEEEQLAINNIRYILDSVTRSIQLGGNRTVFHAGSPKKQDRLAAVNLAITRLETVLGVLYAEGMNGHKLAIESMGKVGQLGNCDEVIEFCKRDSMLYPCIDFGHVNAREQGVLKDRDAYRRLLDKYIDGLGYEKIKDMHVHFSKIEYSAKGEVKHLTFEDTTYGPYHEQLLDVVQEYKLQPYIVCESAGSQAEDAATMKNYWESINIRNKI